MHIAQTFYCFVSICQNDVEIPIPKYFINERLESLKEREKLLGQILTKIGPQDKDDVSGEFQKELFRELKWHVIFLQGQDTNWVIQPWKLDRYSCFITE